MNFSVLRPKTDIPPGGDILGSLYDMHQIVWNLFGDPTLKRRPFLYRIDFTPRPILYVVSDRPPVQAPAGWSLQTTPYAPRADRDEVLMFRLRANPTRRHKNADGSDNGARHDVVMDAKHRRRTKGDSATATSEPELVQAECTRWLADRAERHGFRFDPGHVRADGYRQHRFEKRRGANPLRISSVNFTGRLEVTDPLLFIETLREGIGPAKGFGFGLLLVRRC